MGKSRREIPHFHQDIIETHCHLDYLEESVDEILKKGHDLDVNRLVTIAVEPDNLAVVRELAESYPEVYCTQGLHPHNSGEWSESVEKEILDHLEDKKVVAVGEIGLDYYYLKYPRETQLQTFRRQFDIAIEKQLPIVVHSRDAERDTIEILNELAPRHQQKGVIHSFTSKPELAEVALEHDFYLGFNGITTFKKAEEIRKVVEMAPIESILLETDSPFLTPEPYRGRKNAPYYIPFVAEKVAHVKGLEVSEVIQQTTQNARNLFKKITAWPADQSEE